MKITNILLVSSFLAVFSAVACSSTATPTDDKDNQAGDDDDDDDSTTGKPKTNTGTSSGTTQSSSGSSSGTATGDEAAFKQCDDCMIAKEPKFKTAIECEDAAGEDEAKAAKCFTDIGCVDSPTDPCGKAHAACATECAAADAIHEKEAEEGDEGTKKCLTCVSGNAKAKAIMECYVAAKTQAAADACDKKDEDTCDDGCADEFEKCKTECTPG